MDCEVVLAAKPAVVSTQRKHRPQKVTSAAITA